MKLNKIFIILSLMMLSGKINSAEIDGTFTKTIAIKFKLIDGSYDIIGTFIKGNKLSDIKTFLYKNLFGVDSGSSRIKIYKKEKGSFITIRTTTSLQDFCDGSFDDAVVYFAIR